MSSLRNWVLDVLGPNVTMESVSHALRGLFTHHVSTLSTQQADKLAAQVGTTWVREGVLFEPTVANTALWNPLSTLEMSFTPQTWEGVIPTLTGHGCYSYTCPSAPPGLGRCYSHTCSRTLVKKNRMSQPAPASATAPGGSDWVSFWNLDNDFLRNLDKREIKRQNNILELIKGEEEYVGDLATMLNFQKQLALVCAGPTPVLQPQRVDAFIQRVFGTVKPLLDWNGQVLMSPLRERQTGEGPVIPGVGDIVLKWVRGCSKVYADYSGGYPFADNMVREEESSNPIFKGWLEVLRTLPFGRDMLMCKENAAGSCMSTITV
jgi:RhoGEF domain